MSGVDGVLVLEHRVLSEVRELRGYPSRHTRLLPTILSLGSLPGDPFFKGPGLTQMNESGSRRTTRSGVRGTPPRPEPPPGSYRDSGRTDTLNSFGTHGQVLDTDLYPTTPPYEPGPREAVVTVLGNDPFSSGLILRRRGPDGR